MVTATAQTKPLEKNMDDTSAFLKQAEALKESGNFVEAEKVLREGLKYHEKSAELWSALSMVLVALKQVDAGFAASKQAIAIDPNHAGGYRSMAVNLLRLQRLDEAVNACAMAIKLEPGNAEAYTINGIIFMLAKKLHEAEGMFTRAINLNPQAAEPYANLSSLFAQMRRTDEAIAAGEKAVALKPSLTGSHFLLGLLYKAKNEVEKALSSFKKVLSLEPSHIDSVKNICELLIHGKRFGELEALLQSSISTQPNNPDLHSLMAYVLTQQHKLVEAEKSYRTAITLKPDCAVNRMNLSLVISRQNRIDDAKEVLNQAIAISPENCEAYFHMGNLYYNSGSYFEAMENYRRAFHLNPAHKQALINFGFCIGKVGKTNPDEGFIKDVIFFLSQPDIDHRKAINTGLQILSLNPDIQALTRMMGDEPEYENQLMKALNNELLILLLDKTVFAKPLYEKWFTELRRIFLRMVSANEPSSIPCHDLLYALAKQCFVSEYAYLVTSEEESLVNNLAERLQKQPVEPSTNFKNALAVLCCYMPVATLTNAEKITALANTSDDKKWNELIKQQVIEPLTEQKLKKEMPSFGLVANSVSVAVQSQYEESPYPRWIGANKTESSSIALSLKQTFPHIPLDSFYSPESPRILIAGCGTGYQVIADAYRFSNARIVAVDLSLSSLAYAKRKAMELGLNNIKFMQADILSLESLPKEIGWDGFDIVESTGVLHHMENPMAGWHVLNKILVPNGYMKIALYSETARKEIVQILELIRNQGYSSSLSDIRKCRADIMSLPDSNPMKMVTRLTDFYTASACRDLLFHVQEHRFTLPQIQTAIDELRLKFLGFEIIDREVKQKYLKMFPADPSATSFENWQKFEEANPTTFISMYQFWLQKKL